MKNEDFDLKVLERRRRDKRDFEFIYLFIYFFPVLGSVSDKFRATIASKGQNEATIISKNPI